MSSNLAEVYARSLAELEEDAFEDEVCARFASVIIGFQTIPDVPHGDGGLDGLSHSSTHGYCCYGPQYKAAKTNQDRVDDIVRKFGDDVRRLFELETDGKKLVQKDNVELATILPDGERLVEIKLVVNWFDDHRIVGRIGTIVKKCKKVSRCRFVDPDVQVVVLGPKQLAHQYPVDEITLVRVRQSKFVEAIQVSAQDLVIENAKDFDLKMITLQAIRPDHSETVGRLTALALERELGDTAPQLHQTLERGRQHIATRVTSLMIASDEPWSQLDRAADIARETLNKDFGDLYGSLVDTVASGEIARLIGECPIGWRVKEKINQ
jgi:hypothetical protein